MSDDIKKLDEIFKAADSGIIPRSAANVKMSKPVSNAQNRSGTKPPATKAQASGTSRRPNVKVSNSNTSNQPKIKVSSTKTSTPAASKPKTEAPKTSKTGSVQPVSQNTSELHSEREYMPIRQNREYKSGILGGIFYFIFVFCVSIILATMAWMAVSDVLALNNDNFTAVVELPESIFTTVEVDKFDDDGKLIGTKQVTEADMEYVSVALKDAGLIKYSGLFRLFGKISHGERKLDPGSYELKSSYDYRALIKNMQEGAGATLTATVTIPEGFSMRDIFLKLEENGICKYDALMDAAANYAFNYDFLNPEEEGQATRLEGFLFPDTYEFYVGMDASGAINKFLENFHNKQTEEIIAKVAESGYSMRDVVNMASLIEKEAANNDERSVIASVIFNRIKGNMTLGLECSLLYLHPEHEGAPTAEMYEEESPYNLMKNTGLPPTPICNPGLASIYAVLNPATTNYYYYSLDTESGTHRFFNDYNDFLNFVATQDYS